MATGKTDGNIDNGEIINNLQHNIVDARYLQI